MADHTEQKSAAQLQQEIETQRHRVENTIEEIQEKLSPGQIVDQIMAYTKVGGGEFAETLGKQIKSNPLPVALLGVSLFWLITKPGSQRSDSRRSFRTNYAQDDYDDEYVDDFADDYGDDAYMYDDAGEFDGDRPGMYRTAAITGSALQRIGQTTDERGRRYSEFSDDAGKTFRAETDEHGNRLGHFMDQAGDTFHGFTDAAGNKISEFIDEAGSLLGEATGWASHTWRKAREGMRQAGGGVRHVGGGMGRRASGLRRKAMGFGRQAVNVGGQVPHQAQQMGQQVGQTVMGALDAQPLVGGALAFAAGAALGSVLPHTRQEDQLIGSVADTVKEEAAHVAENLYDKGKTQVESVYGETVQKAGELYEQTKSGLGLSGNNNGASSGSATPAE